MSFAAIIIIAFGLAMDAFAVSLTSGTVIRKAILKNALKIGAYFGGFQAAMPLIGWGVGYELKDYITEFDHWVAMGLLGFIGAKMIYDSMKNDKEKSDFDPTNSRTLLLLAIATSIDALVVGISIAFLEISIIEPVIIIGIITFILSFLGVIVGKLFGEIVKGKAELLGGIVLIAIGIMIVLEHTEVISLMQ